MQAFFRDYDAQATSAVQMHKHMKRMKGMKHKS